jgi:two-component system response regulator PilR (NtrC family)
MTEKKCRILYVDDHDDSAAMLKLILADADYEVETARNMEQALQMAADGTFDLYVLDKRLPDGSGLELVKRLNALTPDVPCVIYTGDAYELHQKEALAAGADAYVPKPDIEQLIETVNRFLAAQHCATAASSA